MVGQIVSHYKILKKLGEGGMGVVYKAEDLKLKRKVALKFLHPLALQRKEDKSRFFREAQAAAALNHPHIATIYEIDEVGGQAFLAMEHVEGQTLRDKVRSGLLSLKEALDIAGQVAEGLQAAHDKGIVHRDIKSSNIMVKPDHRIKIMDFGLAKLTEQSKLTRTATIVGTIEYMSPEQASGEPVDRRTDLWSLGVVLFETLTGQLPFKGEHNQVVLNAILSKSPTPVTSLRSGLPLELERIINKCLEKDPAERFQTAADFRADLSHLSRILSSGEEVLTAPRTKPKRRNAGPRVLIPVAAVLLLAALVALIPATRSAVGHWLGFSRIPKIRILAVLPFRIVGGEDAQKAFCEGIWELLTNKLTQVERFQESLRVVPSSEVRQMKTPTAGEALRAFGANRVITGSALFMPDSIILTLNLVDTKELRQLRSRDLRAKAAETLKLPETVISAVASLLDLEINPRTKAALDERATCEAEASTLYVQARGYMQRYERVENLDLAINLFQRALIQDPRCALSYAGLGEAYWRKYILVSEPALIGLAQEAAARALELNPNLAEVHLTLGIMARETGKLEDALLELQKARDIERENFYVYREIGITYERANLPEDAEAAYRKAVELKPDDWSGYSHLGVFLLYRGRFAEAKENFLKITELTPDNARGYDLLGVLYVHSGDRPRAISAFEKSIEKHPAASTYSNLGTAYFYDKQYARSASMFERALALQASDETYLGNLADAYRHIPGQEKKAEQAYRDAAALANKKLLINPQDVSVLAPLARYYAYLGEREKALDMTAKVLRLAPDNVDALGSLVEAYETVGDRDKALEVLQKLVDLDALKVVEQSPDLDSLKKDDRYRDILAKRRKTDR